MYDRLEDDPRQSEIVLRRMSRFFEAGGLCEAYERRGDDLIQFHDIANLLTDVVRAGVSRDAANRRFLFSAKTGLFGRHGPRQTIEQLIDLDCSSAPRGRYSLRPSYLRVEASPELMRAPRSVWARWLKVQGWPVLPELGTVSRGHVGDRVPASYDPVWISFNEGIRRVMRATACDEREAIKGVIAACRDGAVKSRYGNTHDAIEPVGWVRAAIRKGYRAEAGEYVLIAIVPRSGEIFAAPREMLGPIAPDDGVSRVDRAWSYPPIELRREDIEQLWPWEGTVALSNRAADWGWWLHVPTVALHEAAALSLNIDPRQLRRASTHALLAGRQFEEGPEFELRLTLAKRCLGNTLPGPVNYLGVRYYDETPVVKLLDFTIWALSVEWQIPAQLANLAAGRSERPSNATNPDPQETGPSDATLAMDEAIQRVGRGLYGGDWIGALTERERWLIERYIDGPRKDRGSSILPGAISYVVGGRQWAEMPGDPALLAEADRARDRLDWMEAQHEAVFDWFETRSFDLDCDRINQARFETALAMPHKRGAAARQPPKQAEPVPFVDAKATTHSGFPGRPGKAKHLIEDEFERRRKSGEALLNLADEASALLDWLVKAHPTAPRPTKRTIENNIRDDHRRWRASQKAGTQ